MDEKTKENLKNLGKHAAHGVGDVAEVLGHGIAGATKGVADGVESVSAHNEERKETTDEP